MRPNITLRIETLAREVNLLDECQTVLVYLDGILENDSQFVEKGLELIPQFFEELLARQKSIKFLHVDKFDDYYPEKWMRDWKDITTFAVHITETIGMLGDGTCLACSFDYTVSIRGGEMDKFFRMVKMNLNGR